MDTIDVYFVKNKLLLLLLFGDEESSLDVFGVVQIELMVTSQYFVNVNVICYGANPAPSVL